MVGWGTSAAPNNWYDDSFQPNESTVENGRRGIWTTLIYDIATTCGVGLNEEKKQKLGKEIDGQIC